MHDVKHTADDKICSPWRACFRFCYVNSDQPVFFFFFCPLQLLPRNELKQQFCMNMRVSVAKWESSLFVSVFIHESVSSRQSNRSLSQGLRDFYSLIPSCCWWFSRLTILDYGMKIILFFPRWPTTTVWFIKSYINHNMGFLLWWLSDTLGVLLLSSGHGFCVCAWARV